MTKQLYEEALADVKKVKQLAEANAQRTVLEAVTPRIRELIENQLFEEVCDDDMCDDDLVDPAIDPSSSLSAVSKPDVQGKVVLDIDALGAGAPSPSVGVVADPMSDDEFSVEPSSVDALAPLAAVAGGGTPDQFDAQIIKVESRVKAFAAAGRLVRESSGYAEQITQMISRVEDMYQHVQEAFSGPAKSSYEDRLESCFSELNRLRESKMNKSKKMVNEEDVTLKLTGLPDDVDLDSVGVDLITGEEDESGEDVGDDMGDLDLGDEGGDDMGGEDDMGDLDMGDMGESLNLSDDTIVEIDEKMLVSEIKRMRALREEAKPSANGHGVGSKQMKMFGGGADDGDAVLDHEPCTDGFEPLGEADDMPMDEAEEMSEDLDQLQNRRKGDDYGHDVADGHVTPKQNMPTESMQRRLAFEQRLQDRSKARAAEIKLEAARARASKQLKKEAALKNEYASVARRFNESLTRANNLKAALVETNKRPTRSHPNGGSSRLAESEAAKSLRTQLAETNLINAKLTFTNKLLQSESLTADQKTKVIARLDSAKTVKEAKTVYENVMKRISEAKRLQEGKNSGKVLGSSSRPTRSGSTPLNEGYEADRWARLAGITK